MALKMPLTEMGELGWGLEAHMGEHNHKFHLGEMNEAGRYRKWDFPVSTG